MSTTKEIGLRISMRRKALDMTQTDLARKVNLSDSGRTAVAKWESGKALPSTGIIPELCAALKCDIGYLFGEYDEPLRSVCDVSACTGLSSAAAKQLVSLSVIPKSEKSKRNFLNALLAYESFHYIAWLYQEYIDQYLESINKNAYQEYLDSHGSYLRATKKEFHESKEHALKEAEFKFILSLSRFLEDMTRYKKKA